MNTSSTPSSRLHKEFYRNGPSHRDSADVSFNDIKKLFNFKHITIGRWVTTVYGPGPHIESSTAPSHVGDYYINFGILGVMFGMFLVGSVGRLSHESLMWRGGTAASIMVMTVVLYNLILKFESGVAATYAGILFSILPIWLIHRAVALTLPTFRKAAPEDAVGDATPLADEPNPLPRLPSSS